MEGDVYLEPKDVTSWLAYRESLMRVLNSVSVSQCYCPVSTSNRIVKPLSRVMGVAKFRVRQLFPSSS